MKIVVLDGHTANPGDLDWSGLQRLGECTVYARTAPDDLPVRLQGVEVALTNKVVLGAETFSALPELRYVGVLATGYNVVDVAAARECGVVVTNVPAYATESVAQAVFALLLELTHRVGHHSATVHAGRWCASTDFSYWDGELVELNGRTLGIVGLGAIGAAVARIGRAFGMNVLACTRRPHEVPGVEFVRLEDLFRRSDVISLHCPLTEDTRGLVGREQLAMMKPGAFLVNTSRGPLVDERALAEALCNGTIAGAGLDVLAVEPPHRENPLIGSPNCYITPHYAWATHAARKRLVDAAIENVRAYVRGQSRNVIC